MKTFKWKKSKSFLKEKVVPQHGVFHKKSLKSMDFQDSDFSELFKLERILQEVTILA